MLAPDCALTDTGNINPVNARIAAILLIPVKLILTLQLPLDIIFKDNSDQFPYFPDKNWQYRKVGLFFYCEVII